MLFVLKRLNSYADGQSRGVREWCEGNRWVGYGAVKYDLCLGKQGIIGFIFVSQTSELGCAWLWWW